MQRIAAKSSSPSRYDVESLPAYLASAVDLKKSNDLYKIAHDLTALYPQHAISWYAVGCYYLVAKRSTMLDGISGNQRLRIRRLRRLGLHLAMLSPCKTNPTKPSRRIEPPRDCFRECTPVLCAGMEYSRGSNNASFARSFFEKAAELNPTDALVQNELGVPRINAKSI